MALRAMDTGQVLSPLKGLESSIYSPRNRGTLLQT